MNNNIKKLKENQLLTPIPACQQISMGPVGNNRQVVLLCPIFCYHVQNGISESNVGRRIIDDARYDQNHLLNSRKLLDDFLKRFHRYVISKDVLRGPRFTRSSDFELGYVIAELNTNTEFFTVFPNFFHSFSDCLDIVQTAYHGKYQGDIYLNHFLWGHRKWRQTT